MKQTSIAKIALFLTAAIWGSTFAISKLITDVFSASFIVAFRFMIACVVLIFVSFPKRNLLNKSYFVWGFWMGITLFASYMLQVIGLTMETSPGKSAFLCTTYSVMVPFLYWFITKEMPKFHHILCVFLCLIGVGILSLSGGWHMSNGDILTVLSGIPYAFNIVLSSIACRNRDALLLTTIQLSVVAIFALMVVIVGRSFPTQMPLASIGAIIYLGLFATALCLYFQSYGLKYENASVGGMILSLESVFGVIFSILLYKEQITIRMLLGFVIIFMAILLSQKE